MPITYDKKTKRYKDSRGRFIPLKKVRFEIDKFIQEVAKKAGQIAVELTAGRIVIAVFQKQLRDVLKAAYTVAGSVAKGGWKQMSPSDWGKIGAKTKKQYGFLNNFALKIADGSLSIKQIEARAKSYPKSARTVYESSVMEAHTDLAAELEDAEVLCERELHAKESCDECVDWASQGYIPVEDQPEIGSLECGDYCLCTIDYKVAGQN